jgi:hypothetical protein
MTKRQFVVIAFRVIAVYLFLNFITNLSSFLRTIRTSLLVDDTSSVFIIGVVGLSIVAALFVFWLLWHKSQWMMERILAVPVLQDEPLTEVETKLNNAEQPIAYDPYDSPLTTNSITQIAFSAIGLSTSLTLLPHLLHSFRSITLGFDTESYFDRPSWIGDLLPELIPLAIGIWLFLRPWQWQQWLSKLKPTELETAPAEIE